MLRYAWGQLCQMWSGASASSRRSSSRCEVDVDRCTKEICQLVVQAAEHMMQALRSTPITESNLNNRDLVTATDREIEQLLADGLRRQFFDHVFIGEEGLAGAAKGRKLTNNPTWIIDPIDGTTNFVHGFPFNCISVGFWLNKRPELAVCHNPTLDMMFTARRNRGCFLNGTPTRVSRQTELERSLIMHQISASSLAGKNMDKQWANAFNMLSRAQTIHSTGSAVMDMCLVAMGAADGYFAFNIHSWDVAASVLLVQEAGGVVMDPAGGKFDLMSRRVLAAATPELARQIVQVLGNNQIYHKRDDATQ